MASQKVLEDRKKTCSLLKLAEKKASSPEAFVKVANAVLKYSDDNTWKEEIKIQLDKREQFTDIYANFIKKESECSTSGCFRNLARKVLAETEDRAYCARLYEKAEERCCFFNDYLLLANEVHEHLGDRKRLEKIYRQMLANWDELPKINTIIEHFLSRLDNGERWAREIYHEKEDNCRVRGDFIRLAVSVFRATGDQEWARRLYRQAQQHCRSRAEYMVLAWSIHENFGGDDWGWVISLYRKAFELCTDHLHFNQVIRSVIGTPNKILEEHPALTGYGW